MTLTELLREGMKQAIANGEDLTQPGNRTIFLKSFIEKHKDDPEVPNDIKTLRSTASRVFESELGKENIEIKKATHKKTKYNSKLASEISAKTSEKKSGIKDEKKTDEKKEGDKGEKKEGDKGEKKINEVRQAIYDHWNAEGVGAVFDAMLTPLRVAWPETPPLSLETKRSLGEMWLPAFQRYGDEKLQFLIFPAIGTIGILAPVVVEGRKKHKESEEKKKKQKENNQLTEEEETRINKLTCKFCNEMFDSAHIKGHEGTCKKRIKSS